MSKNVHLIDETEPDNDSELLPVSASGVTLDGWSFSLIRELEDDDSG